MTSSQARSRAQLRTRFPHRVASARRLVAAGVPERTVYNRCRSGGPSQRPLPGVIVLTDAPLTTDQKIAAALELGGDGAIVTGLVAVRRHGIVRGPRALRADPPDEVHVLIEGRQVRDAGFVHVERTSRPPEPQIKDGFPFAPPARAMMDAARRLHDHREITEMFADGVQRGRTTVGALWTEMELGSRRGTADPRQMLRDVRDGVRSVAEQDAKRLLSRSRVLPKAQWNVEIRCGGTGRSLGIADCWFDDVALDWEIDSTEYHLSPADHDRSVHKVAALTAAGVTVLPAKPRDISRDGRRQLRLLEQTYLAALACPRPPVVAVPRST